MSYRHDVEWLFKVRQWHQAHGLPLPPTFPDSSALINALIAIRQIANTTARTFPNAPGVGDWMHVYSIASAAIDNAKVTNHA